MEIEAHATHNNKWRAKWKMANGRATLDGIQEDNFYYTVYRVLHK